MEDYAWAAMDAVLDLPVWRRVKHFAITVLAKRIPDVLERERNVRAIEQFFIAQATEGLPRFLQRGGSVHIICTGMGAPCSPA